MIIVSKDMIKRTLLEALRALKSKDYAIAEVDILEALSMLDYLPENERKPWCWP